MVDLYPPQGSGATILGVLGYRKSGRYHTGQITAMDTSTGTRTINILYATPFIVALDESFDTMAIEVTTASAAGKIARLGVYKNQAGRDPFPGSLLIDAGTVATDSNGVKTLAASLPLSKGLYWLAFVTNAATVGVRIVGDDLGSILGFPATIGTGGIIGLSYTVAQAFGALPDPFPVGANIDIFSSFIWIRKV